MNNISFYPACLDFQSYLLVGIKGVGMASLAAVLVDMGKEIFGWDVKEDFVTKKQLDRLRVRISDQEVLPDNIQAVIYTAAHHDVQHPLVQQAIKKGIPCFSLAEVTGALSQLKPTIAVCGVGGKSTTSAMLAWIFGQITRRASYMVGVGEIKGLNKTGSWSNKQQPAESSKKSADDYFMVEADEYATNPTAIHQGQPAQPRFLSLTPQIIICTQILHDHPDVYPSINDTLKTFEAFFQKLPSHGLLISNADDTNSQKLILQFNRLRPDIKIIQVGNSKQADVQIAETKSILGQTSAKVRLTKQIRHDWQVDQNEWQLNLSIPGQMNLRNAVTVLVASVQAGLPIEEVISALQSFQSTSRRLEKVAEKDQVIYYDDYAHHPQEISAAIEAIKSWYPDLPLTIIFQPHTYSRTKSLLADFAHCLAEADHVILLPIFSSAREQADPTTSSQQIVDLINQIGTTAQLASTSSEAADFVVKIKQGLVVTMGAGDVYLIHELLNNSVDRKNLDNTTPHSELDPEYSNHADQS